MSLINFLRVCRATNYTILHGSPVKWSKSRLYLYATSYCTDPNHLNVKLVYVDKAKKINQASSLCVNSIELIDRLLAQKLG